MNNKKAKWKHFIDAENNIYKKAIVNGYDYGDVILENVTFELNIDDEGELSIKVEDSHKEYFSELDENYWYGLILDSVSSNKEAYVKNGISINEVTMIKDTINNIDTNNKFDIPISNINDINDLIKDMNNGKSDITMNPDILESLGLKDVDVEDPELIEYTQKLQLFHNEIIKRATQKNSELSGLNKAIDRNLYWESFYNAELYDSILNKFFNKEYFSHPKIRLDKIKVYLEEIGFKFKPYLESISYKITNSEEIEAFEKEYLAKNLLTEFFPIVKKTKIENIDFKELGSNISNEKKKGLSDFLREIEAGELTENNNSEKTLKILSEYDLADLKGKIKIKYDEVLKRAIELDKEEDGLIKTYVECLYNPDTTLLDDKNLLLNLLLISRMQDFGVMSWAFDETRVNVSNTEINLKHDWWNKILEENIEEDLKYIKIVEKDLNLSFYTTFLTHLFRNADKLKYGEMDLKYKKILSDDDDDTSRESLLLDTVIKKTQKESILFISQDMERWIQPEFKINEEIGDRGQVRYIGVWKERHIFIINHEKIKGLEKYSNTIIFVNKGNNYVLNPEKPIVYFNVIENPFLERPLIKWFCGADFDISMDKSGIMRVENNFLE